MSSLKLLRALKNPRCTCTRSIQSTAAPITTKSKVESFGDIFIKDCTTFQVGTTTFTFPNLFLRDSSQHSAHLHSPSQQKLFKTTDIPIQGNVTRSEIIELKGEEWLQLQWSTAIQNMGEDSASVSLHPLKWLIETSKIGSETIKLPPTKPWSTSSLLPIISTTSYTPYMTDDAQVQQHLTSLIQDGIAFIIDVPVEKREGHETSLKEVVERVSSLRKTWYGDLWDVKAEEGSKNIAYTNLDLGLHMDLTHFESPPRYQYLHSLQNSHIKGGLSYFVDSFHVAAIMKEKHLEAYQILCEESVTFEYKNGGQHTKWIRPTIELSPKQQGQSESQRTIWAINYSPPFQGPFKISTLSTESLAASTQKLLALQSALKIFAELCDLPELQFKTQLNPGVCVVFDNRRVLHARTSFEFMESGDNEVEKGRWLKGAYTDGDETWSRWRVGAKVKKVSRSSRNVNSSTNT